jgi:putrescine transport system substrate-binding protein
MPTLKILAPAESFEPGLFQAFEQKMGVTVLVDNLEPTTANAPKPRLGAYDVALLPTADFLRAATRGELMPFDRARAGRLRAIPSDIEQKFDAYGAWARFAVPYDWTAIGIAYDRVAVAARIGGAPNWTSLFQPDSQRLLLDCGLELPDDRDALFYGAWRSLDVDPTKAQPFNVAPAAYLVTRARKIARVFGPSDSAGVFATGAACIGIASYTAVAAAKARIAKDSGVDLEFVVPKEGGGLTFDALAVPKETTHLDAAYALIAFLEQPEISTRNAKFSGTFDVYDDAPPAPLAPLQPLGALDPKILALVDQAWMSARVSDPPQLPPRRPRTAPAH